MIVGALFYWLRTKWRVTYGLSEACLGVAIASHRAYDDQVNWAFDNFSFYAAVITAGVYLVVRGFDNVSQGQKLTTDPILILWDWFKKQTITTDRQKLDELYGQLSSLGIKKTIINDND